MVTLPALLGSSSNHHDGEGNMKIKRNMQQVWVINRKKSLNVQRTFWQISLPLSHEWRSQTLSKWQCDRSFSPRPDVCGYFLIHKFFFADSKISTSTRIRIQIEFARPHETGFTLSSSAFFVIKRSSAQAKILSPVCFTDKIVPSSTIFRSFDLFTASNPSVPHGKKLQNVKPPFAIIEVYSNHSYIERQTCWDTSIKCPPFEQWTYLSPSPEYSHPFPPKPMLCFRPWSLSLSTNNIDSGVGWGIYGV